MIIVNAATVSVLAIKFVAYGQMLGARDSVPVIQIEHRVKDGIVVRNFHDGTIRKSLLDALLEYLPLHSSVEIVGHEGTASCIPHLHRPDSRTARPSACECESGAARPGRTPGRPADNPASRARVLFSSLRRTVHDSRHSIPADTSCAQKRIQFFPDNHAGETGHHIRRR